MTGNPLRHLPGVDALLKSPAAENLIAAYGRPLTTEAIRYALDAAREQIMGNGGGHVVDDDLLIENASQTLEEWLAPTLCPVINATGVIVHTNLGRAPLSDAAIAAMQEVASGYSTLEFDIESGKRGSRSVHAETLLRRLTGAEAALVVNNNAAAVLLTLTALAGPSGDYAEGRGVIISRGELVEIGGGFRIPDVMAQSGAQLIEVGTTNRTHLYDYERAIDDHTALILRAHRSNFALVGFTTEPDLADIASLAHSRDLLVADDLGSGALIDPARFGLTGEPTIADSLEADVDVLMFSGDKLVGGPQAGIILGKQDVVQRLKKHPLARAVRADKLALAALSATLGHYLKDEALTEIPIWQMIASPLETVTRRAQGWAEALSELSITCDVITGRSTVGGGSLPGETLPSALLAIDIDSPDRAAAHLRAHDPPVIARIENDRLLLDPRTVLPREENAVLSALKTLQDLQ